MTLPHATGLQFRCTCFLRVLRWTLLPCFLSAAVADAQIQSSHSGVCFSDVLPDDWLHAAPRRRHCTEGSFHPGGLPTATDPTMFVASDFGLQTSRDFAAALAGGPSPVVPPGVELAESFAAASITTHGASAFSSTAVDVENRGGSLIAPVAGGGATTAGAGWGSHTTLELLPFSVGSAEEVLPIRFIPRFSGRFLGSGGGDQLNSRLSYAVTVQTRDSASGGLVQRAHVEGTVGLNGDGDLISDGAISQLFVTLKRDGSGEAQAQFRPLEIMYSRETDDSLIVTTSFTGFGSFAADDGPATADGSESALLGIMSFDDDVRFQHANPFRDCRLTGRGEDCRRRWYPGIGINDAASLIGDVATAIPGDTIDTAHALRDVTAAVPEPGGAVLALCSFVVLTITGRRRSVSKFGSNTTVSPLEKSAATLRG